MGISWAWLCACVRVRVCCRAARVARIRLHAPFFTLPPAHLLARGEVADERLQATTLRVGLAHLSEQSIAEPSALTQTPKELRPAPGAGGQV